MDTLQVNNKDILKWRNHGGISTLMTLFVMENAVYHIMEILQVQLFSFKLWTHRAAAAASAWASDWSHWNAFSAPLAAPNRPQIHCLNLPLILPLSLPLTLDARCGHTLTAIKSFRRKRLWIIKQHGQLTKVTKLHLKIVSNYND